jgi:hypothetical protein
VHSRSKVLQAPDCITVRVGCLRHRQRSGPKRQGNARKKSSRRHKTCLVEISMTQSQRKRGSRKIFGAALPHAIQKLGREVFQAALS